MGSNLLVNRITRKGGLTYIGTLSRKNSVGFMFVSLLIKGQFFLIKEDPVLEGLGCSSKQLVSYRRKGKKLLTLTGDRTVHFIRPQKFITLHSKHLRMS